MLSRTIGILIAPWLPGLALILPLSPFHTANALVAGLVAAVLTGVSLGSDRARFAAAIVGAWVAFTPFVVRSSLTEIVLCVCWGVTMFVSLAGPFSQTPQSTSSVRFDVRRRLVRKTKLSRSPRELVMEPLSVKRIVVGIDFSEGSDAAMAQALSFAAAFHAAVDLVHVVEPALLATPASLGGMALIDGPALFEEIDRALTSRAGEAQAAGLVCQTNTLEGFPPGELVRHAKKTRADLIIVGTHGRTGIAHAVLGSVAERVVQRAPCPVLVIPQHREVN